MPKRIDYHKYGLNNDVGTNTESQDVCICSQCTGAIPNANLQHFGMAVNQTTNLATTVPIISCEFLHVNPPQEKKEPSLSKASSKGSKNYGSSKKIKNKKIFSKFKAPSRKCTALERRKRVKKRMPQSVITVTTGNNSDEESDVGINSDHSMTSAVSQQEHKNATSKRRKPQIKKKLCGKRDNLKRNDSLQKEEEKEMDDDSTSCMSSIPDKSKNKVVMQDGPCNATAAASKKKSIKKKKNECKKFRYLIETTTPLPYGTFEISVDKNSITPITPCGDSGDELNECSCDKCEAGTSSGENNCKRVSNYKMFVQKYKSKSACKRGCKKR
ncbi:uncharacterized protein LOC119670053 [Teleopsis dalmanni]|uniref:uncharacterized protein LOC119670053 n=1 Tax=Teleopsis dalmanni TaxID=139649 RepID=UPI0018CE0696|nr:uncharacterized protein LOC119670053 [Teleopsis dalmanni]